MRAHAIAIAVIAVSTNAFADEPRGWIGVGGRNAFGLSSPMYPDFGFYAMGGAWMLNEHVQPFVRAGWSRGPGVGVTIDAMRLGAGIAVGWSFARDVVWLGAAAAGESVTAFSRNSTGTIISLEGMISISALFQIRIARRFLIGVEAGPDFYPSPLYAPNGVLEWDVVRLCAGLRLGVILGK